MGKRQLYTKGELIQKQRIHKTETKRTKQENKHKENITKR